MTEYKRAWLNVRWSASVSGFLSPGLWSFPVFSFWCLALQPHKTPHEGNITSKYHMEICKVKSLFLKRAKTLRQQADWTTDTRTQRHYSYLSCLRAYSSILIRLTRSCFIFSCPFLSPCRNATWAWKHTHTHTQDDKEHKVLNSSQTTQKENLFI